MFIAEFINYLHLEKKYSSHTITAYKADLLVFFEFYEKEFNTSEVIFDPGLLIW